MTRAEAAKQAQIDQMLAFHIQTGNRIPLRSVWRVAGFGRALSVLTSRVGRLV